ncbi:LytTR family transcriptional regulator DNA-binding domain-containing protein [Paenibacillus nasutitermitis]|uniref:HTH LytTR-type domain-containing protein n=1 Tax=Paenibacillus nasutitermitis TaxID=1652958 RepID=A0A917DX62_9BACL|nr:LytTR family transcriptional regulator DNA-binding domain-containing protein [Paenibacillus nasutitermitis]GGD75161.1 hypothetical protein GCM10010911_36360 [Paenibacillus nasutitermitis]
MQIPVVKKLSKKDFVIEMIAVADVLYTYIQDGTLMYQTKRETYSQISTLEEQERFLMTNGFQKVERGYLVQMNKIEYFDEERSCVFFEQHPASKDAPNAPVSRIHKKDVEMFGKPAAIKDKRIHLSNS